MPDRIRHLPQELTNQIAAGEVVERPASVLKELVENSIDAEGTRIVIKIEKGGARLISVADNGIGMSSKDAIIAFGRHATSKISSREDLFNIHTLGFRGEALASIAAVAKVRLKTREHEAAVGTCVEIAGGEFIRSTDAGCPPGTEIEVRDLFYNVPARKSFLKGQATELGHMLNIVTQHALGYKDIHLTLMNMDKGGVPLLDFPPVGDIEERLFQIYGGDILRELMAVSCETEGCSIQGFIARPSLTFRSRENQLFFVNKRSVRNSTLSHAVQEAYSDLIPRDRYTMAVLWIGIDPASVDVNVHPSKREVKFRDNRYIHDRVAGAVRDSLRPKGRASAYPEAFESAVRPEIREGIAGHPNPFIDDREFHPQEISVGPSIRVFGQVGALFMVGEINGELHIIDQHAAHERVLYDRLKKGYAANTIEVQYLLIPEIIELSLDKVHVLTGYKEALSRLGFDIEEMGERSFMIRTVPALFAGEDCRALITDMIDEMIERESSSGRGIRLTATEDILNALLSRKACHKAVRGKDLLSHGEMASLLSALLQTDMPYTCPHGRPIVKRFSYTDLEKMFGRT
ncbi:MAG: DNA mismatch repair endonuclease MutL [Nitrospirae bacterium]|nr:DNA mismatch repair endonuclease MutL [Nitrospirota bacterium]